MALRRLGWGCTAAVGVYVPERVRRIAERDHYAALLSELHALHLEWAALHNRHARATAQHERICARIRNLTHALAWSAARWAVDQAIATGCNVIDNGRRPGKQAARVG
jgi:hypothetical protein